MKATPTVPRVLLLEDDPSVRRLVALALEEEALELVQCATLYEARQALAQHPIQLLLVDMTLPDGSGLTLLDGLLLRRTAPDTPAPIVVIFSGGVDALLQRQLTALGVWRVLHKPVSITALVQCTRAALAASTALQPTPAASASTIAPNIAAPTPTPTAATADVPEFFAAQPALFAAYRRTCLTQFVCDLAQGEQAAADGDAPALRRIAHNLKSVLSLLGHHEAAQQARRTEELAHSAHPQMHSAWQALRAQVQSLL